MTTKKKRKRYPGPWREVSREFTGKFEVRTTQQGPFNVCAVYTVRHRQATGPGQYIEERTETRGFDLNHVLRELGVEDKSYAIITMASGAFAVIEKLFGQYQWKLDQERFKEAKRKADVLKEKHQSRYREMRLMNKKFTRRVEV